MADSAVPITAGTGTNIDTFTQASGDHRQAVVVGDKDAASVAGVDTAGRLAVNTSDKATLCVTATGAAAAAVTLTLPAPAAGLFHYITQLEITAYTTAARTGTATPVVVTTTNLPGTPAFTFASAGAIGTTDRYLLSAAEAFRSSVAATATTVVGPATTAVIWRITAFYYTAI